ncbi:MAG: dienelactone hydrolase family protein, partial [Geminicoccaceae bacterium]|nr:dienelactone hydrolase family protein [Geminicoccaceae bacterium]
LADAYAALRLLDADPAVDGRRVALRGFSYGGMASVFAAYTEAAERLAPDGPRFAGHVAFYAPCIARFEDPRTTGAPVLMVMGARDQIIDLARCREIERDLKRGGSPVRMVVYPDAFHQWDGGFGSWRAPRGLADCRLEVERSGVIRDRRTLIPMSGPLTRKVILGLCSDREGYLIARDDEIRVRSNRVLGRFLADVLAPGTVSGATVRGGRSDPTPASP